ncbi:hypothetical protein ACFFF5_10675 [Lederbergia wuyishanensis]|uniref:Uncharacterized protein n=1 Tax=Lederbergia wuyishanensis TaxID=1347903 RepID=A0ABU0D6Q9_9BACI|nr:hypothetical protein [Lederbergia wuyishanensis]MCJ8008781.1 hypothetical protein [Lederbergia wuyishanensis]MDQ0344102.1 hypothetical protein [Lederbergia wuyishanensis]
MIKYAYIFLIVINMLVLAACGTNVNNHSAQRANNIQLPPAEVEVKEDDFI